jgi:MFS family permease
MKIPGLSRLTRLPTFAALKYRNYQLYWSGLLAAVMGWQILTFTQLWLIYDLTNSPLYLGLAGGINGTASIVCSVFGGVLADRMDKKKLLFLTQSTMAVVSISIGILTFTHLVNVWHILVMSAITGVFAAFDNPARQSIVPQLIDDRQYLTNAVALAASVWSGTRIIGPALAGILIAVTGPAVCFFITFAGYCYLLFSLTRIRLARRERPQSQPGVLDDFKEGWTYVFNNKNFFSLIMMTFLNSVFGMSYIFMLPVFAKDILNAGSSGYGFLMAASGIGSVLGILTVASLGKYEHRGRLLLIGSSCFGILLMAFSFSRWYPFSLVMLALAGFFNSLYMTNVLTLLQSLVPDRLRGRIMGIYSLTWSLQPLGGLQAGFVASIAGAPIAVTIGGAIILVYAAISSRSGSRIRSLG